MVRGLAAAAAIYLLAAYLVIPLVWEKFAATHPSFDDHPRITTTSDDHPGDPLNVALLGTKEQVDDVMRSAKWFPAAALGLRSDLRIAGDTVLSRPDDEAPVSSLYLFGRKEDFAFEQPSATIRSSGIMFASGKQIEWLPMADPCGSGQHPMMSAWA